MAVVATLSKGYDLEYIWKNVDRGATKDAASYYIQASESGGEPPGRWWGPGARALGFDHGQRVERKPYDLLFGERKAPDGTPLGRPPGNGRKAADLYAKLLAAEPHATADRKHELRIEATKQARQSPLFFDLTVSLSKSISIFHASLGENARLARQAGDRDGDQYWSALVTEVDDMIWQAVHVGFGYFQREAGYTRTGSHNTRVHGRETGQWHEADLAVAHWLQHTSRDDDMQLHVHSQIAHVAKTSTDGKWRAPDSLGYNEHIGAVAAIVSQHLEEALTHRFGLEWTARDDGHGFEIKGISGDMMRVFSSRRASITADLRARAARFEQRYGRAPSQRELAQLAQASNFKTRAAKEGALDFAQLHAGWADKLARTLGVSLASVAPSVWHGDGGRADTHARDPDSPAPVPAELEQARAAQKAVALAQQEKSTWTRADVIKYLGRVLPRTGMDPAAAAALLEDLADRALASEFESVTCLEAPEPAEVPRSLLRADGPSVYQRHGGTRYATRAQLVMEERMLTQAGATNASRLDHAQAAHALGADPEQLNAALTRRADATVLAEYDQHGCIAGGDLEQMMDAAAAAYVALAADGTDVLLMAADHGLRRELCRRIRDDLITLGAVAAGPAVRIADGARASAGDLITCTRNDHRVEAGEPGRALANGDLLRVEAVTAGGLVVRRALDADPATGQRRWTDRTFLYPLFGDAELGYAVTDHVAQGRTVHTGLAVITGTEDRQHAYVALPRGTDANLAYVFTTSPKRADPVPGPRPAPELARYDKISAERSGVPAPATEPAPPGTALGVLAGVLDRDGQQLSATQTRQQALADADHLAVLHAIWTAETAPARQQRYRDLLLAALPPEHRRGTSHQARWLWRTLRGAELAGLDAGQVLADAIAERDLAGARDVPSVVDARIRYRLGSLVPISVGPWSAQVPRIADPERRAYVTEIAALMDARKDRIGEHAAEHGLPWAVAALGPAPAHPLDRLDWQKKATAIGAFRELSGHDHPADPIGPEPAAAAPDVRAAWYEALAALGPAGGPDARGMPDGRLLHLRDTYPVETAWAPQYVGDELRQVRAAAWNTHLAALRASAEAKAASSRGQHDTAARQQDLAGSYHALDETYRQRETVFAAVMADRADWDAATRAQRHLAVAADAELRRRHPGQRFTPLRSAEPLPATQAQRDELTLTPGQPIPEPGQWIKDLAAAHQAFADTLAERQNQTIPPQDPGYGNLGQAFPPWPGPAKDAILQPPKPEIRPCPQVLERAAATSAGSAGCTSHQSGSTALSASAALRVFPTEDPPASSTNPPRCAAAATLARMPNSAASASRGTYSGRTSSETPGTLIAACTPSSRGSASPTRTLGPASAQTA